MNDCVTCGWAEPEKGRRECSACRMYRRRHGKPRPDTLIFSHAERTVHRVMEQMLERNR